MNAKKIMGAVLVALLAAALFVGAGAAEDVNKGTVFVYENTTLAGVGLEDGVWTAANGAQISVTKGVVYPGANFVAGDYKYNGTTVYVTYPTATYTIGASIGTNPEIPYIALNGGNIYSGSKLTIGVSAVAANISIDAVMNGAVKIPYQEFLDNATAGNYSVAGETYNFVAVFNKTNFVDGVPVNYLKDTVSALTYTVVEAKDATISANVDTVFQNEEVTLTIKGTPGTKYILNTTGFTIENNQYVAIPVNSTYGYEFVMPNTGEASFVAKVTADKKATVELRFGDAAEKVDDSKLEIAVSAPVITVTLDAESYFIGNDIKLSGTTSHAVGYGDYTFNISGVNFKSTIIPVSTNDWKEEGKNWEVILSTHDVKEVGTGKALDVGTYTIEIISGYTEKGEAIIAKTIPVALKQPFISIIDAPEVIAQGDEAEFLINAEATQVAGIQAYVFGTNYFLFFANTSADIDMDSKNKNQFTVTIGEDVTKNMSTGQYFMVFQHPMYDELFQIKAEGTDIKLDGTPIFNVYDRQTANAAQALCDALDSQNFDDMYVKYSFFVVGQDESFSINAIPTEVAQGETITISGVDTANEGATVTVQMLSTAFAAVPKETVGSAAFILVTTEVAEDGTWEVTLDTSDLNVDEYSLSVAIDNVPKKTVTVNVVEAADEPVNPEQPEQPENPENPTEPEAPATPGFGALAALAGLGAVAVLLLRRE